MKKVIVLGGGFAGIQAAIALQKSNRFDVTLVSDRDYLYLYPISIWVPVRTKEFDDVKVPLSQIQKQFGFKVTIDRVQQLVPEEKKVVCKNNAFHYDYLIVALGAEKMQHKGMEYTTSICGKPEQVLDLRKQIDDLIARGSGKIAIGFGGNPKDKTAVRGGPAFELIFNLHNYLKRLKLRPQFELTFFAPMEEPGAKMGGNSLAMLDKLFGAYQINKRFGKKIKEFAADGVVFEDDSKLDADVVMFIAAGTGHSVLSGSDLPLNEAGFVKVNDFGQAPGFPEVYCIGDAAAIEGPEWAAKQGHIAELMGRNAAYNIIQTEQGKNYFKGYREHLNILCVMDTGDGAAFVFRNHKKSFLIPLPIVGHWMKKGWGLYSKLTKVSAFPRLPGL
ncbi:MAG: Sulfide-quinone reductase [Haliscomenobacter sp.]|jgi:sulfide:quinone oxidoreductase|nr:Sulfide-quinone reductase [Haliscomenobacter sp.]